MTDLAPFADVEETVLELIEDLAANLGTFVPADLKTRLPFVLAYRFAGADDRITDNPVIGIDVFAATRAAGFVLAEQIRQRLIAAPHAVTTTAGVVVIDSATTGEAPHEVPWGDSDVRRWVSSYRLTLRR